MNKYLKQPLKHIFKYACFLLIWCAYTGCNADKEEMSKIYKEYKFDRRVIERLPLYDSLGSAIIKNYRTFDTLINAHDSYRAYRYKTVRDDMDIFNILPPAAGPEILEYYQELGPDFISGFDVFQDSTIKIYIRNYAVKNSLGSIEENLSYYPRLTQFPKREYPAKDSTLNKHWQYWARVNMQGVFD